MDLKLVIEQYMIDCESRGRADGTLATYRRHLGLLVRWLADQGVTALEGVTLLLLRQFQHFLMHSAPEDRYEKVVQRGRLQASTVGLYVESIKVFFRWCYEEDLIPANPAARLKKPTAPKKIRETFTSDDIKKLLATCDTDTRHGFRNYVMLSLFLDTGMRVSELCTLRLSNVHARYVKVEGKGQKEREIGIHPDVSKLIWKYVHKVRPSFGIESEYVFVGEKGPLTVHGVETIFDKIERESGVKANPHKMRHTHSFRYLDAGGDVFKLSRELGHSSVQVTGNIYLSDFKSADARKDHDKFSPVADMKLGRPKGNGKSKRGKK